MSAFAELHGELRAVARDLLAKDVADDTRWRQVTDAGWTGLEVPEALDGSGVTFAETAVVLEELGRAVSALPFLGTVLAVAAGVDEVSRAVASGARAAVALAPHADAAELVAPFRLDAVGRLTGRAELVVDAPSADHLLLLADGPAGFVLVHRPGSGSRNRPGDDHSGGQNGEDVGSGPSNRPEGVDRGGQNGDIRVLAEAVLDRTRALATVEADGVPVAADDVHPIEPAIARAVLDRAAVAVALDAHGIAAAMLDTTVAYACDRHQFGRPIGSFQAVKHQCADVLVSLRIGRELLDDAVAAIVAGDPEVGIAASRAKAYVTSAAVGAAGTAMQLHGGIGYTWESGIHRYLKRALLDRALFGSPAEHRRRIADVRWP